jgi:protein-disulfide isomerase
MMNKMANAYIANNEHVLGPSSADVTIVEYGDFQCPFSARAHAALKDLRDRIGSRMRLVYRHFPLVDEHPLAEPAAEAAEAAGAQGKYWQMHDALYTHQAQLTPHALLVIAESLDLDIERFQEDMLGGRHEPRVMSDLERGKEDGVDMTPTFFINGERYFGNSDEASLARAIGGALH